MTRFSALVLAAAALGLAAGCGGTSNGPGGAGGAADTAGQETNDQPEATGLRTPAYTAANNVCSLLPLEELARQNNVKASVKAVATKVAASETNAKDRKDAYRGCVDALKTG